MTNSSNSLFVLFSLLPLVVLATNDWSKPCLQGVCSYDVPASENSMSGSISINGSPDQISDITTAAGWEILGCSATMPAQDIRLVCSGDEDMCSHLYQNGAENTVVRLPEECGTGPFARVANAWVSEDQSIPAGVKSRLLRRDVTPVVHALSIDMNFDQAPPPQNGDVTFLLSGPNYSGSTGDAGVAPSAFRSRSRRVNQRGLGHSIASELKGISERLSDASGFNDSNETTLPININKQFNIFNQSLSCSDKELGISVDIGVQVGANVLLGFAVAGSIIPPNLSKAGVFATLTGNINGSLDVNANIVGELDLGKIPLFTLPLAGIDVPGIFTLGPSFVLEAEAKATIDLDLDLSVDLAYSVENLTLYFPQSANQSSNAKVSPKSGPLKLSVSPSVSSNTTLEAHLIPSLNIGLSAFGASATVFLDVDTAAILDLSLNASKSAGASAEVDGCVDLNGEVSVDVGAEGSFPGLFDASTQTSLFQKDFNFFQKCFSESVAKKNSGTSVASSTKSMSSKNTATTASHSSGMNATRVGSSMTSTIDAGLSHGAMASDHHVSTSMVVAHTSRMADSSNIAMPSDSVTPSSSYKLPAPSASAASPSSSSIKSRRSDSASVTVDFSCPVAAIAAAVSVIDEIV